MIPHCDICDREMEVRLRGDVRPTDLFDDATVMLFRCPLMTHSAAIALIQSERRGSLDDETIDTKIIPIAEYQLKRLEKLAATCPNKNDWQCDCAWHQTCRADAIIANQSSLEKKVDEPYSEEDERERNTYHYGRSA